MLARIVRYFVCAVAGLALEFASVAAAQDSFGDISGLKLVKAEDKVDVPGTPAPPGAIVLFDGRSLDGWQNRNGQDKAGWTLVDGGVLQVKSPTSDIITKETFGSRFKLHLEFRCGYQPEATGQRRGNSGVYLQGRYEVQILDSYGTKGGLKDDCGAIYSVAAPTTNVCKAPTVWQSYDIEFQSPRCENGKKVDPAVMTVTHNGVKIHDQVLVTIDNSVRGLGGDVCTPGPILLQENGCPVQYRNIWLLPQKDADTANSEPKRNPEAAVQAGIAFLFKQQQTNGSWKVDADNYPDGVSALCTLALLNGGVDVQDERAQRALRWLRGQEPKMTYSLALQTLVYCRARAPEDVERIRRNVVWLVEAQARDGDGKGGWSYGQTSGGRADGSCTRFAIWALDAARHADVNIPESVWRLNADYWLASQLEDGAWGYTPMGKHGTVTMTLAGIFCLASTKAAVADNSLHARIDQNVERAWKRHDQWCEDSWPTYLKSNRFRFYALQSLGQAATRTGRVKIGDVDWKPSVTRLLLAEQQAESGRWEESFGGSALPLVGTSLALLFLTEK